jgi:hypothetical protein
VPGAGCDTPADLTHLIDRSVTLMSSSTSGAPLAATVYTRPSGSCTVPDAGSVVA